MVYVSSRPASLPTADSARRRAAGAGALQRGLVSACGMRMGAARGRELAAPPRIRGARSKHELQPAARGRGVKRAVRTCGAHFACEPSALRRTAPRAVGLLSSRVPDPARSVLGFWHLTTLAEVGSPPRPPPPGALGLPSHLSRRTETVARRPCRIPLLTELALACWHSVGNDFDDFGDFGDFGDPAQFGP